MLRRLVLVSVVVLASACTSSPTAPVSIGTAIDVAGAWNGTFSSSNNQQVPIALNITQNGSSLTGTWQTTIYQWSGELTASLQGGTLSGNLTFKGITSDGTNCTGSATLSGAATESAISLTSDAGVVGSACPAPLPVGINIDLHR